MGVLRVLADLKMDCFVTYAAGGLDGCHTKRRKRIVVPGFPRYRGVVEMGMVVGPVEPF
jgi:hypothetical protein